MHLPIPRLLAVAALACCGACASARASSASAAPKHGASDAEPAAAAPAPMNEAEMMAEMMKLAKPGPEQAELAAGVGQWEDTFRMRFDPNGPWQEIKGSSERTPLLDGRYVMEHTNFVMLGQPMETVSIVGFDKRSGEYTCMWADMLSTWWTTAHGKRQPDGSIDLVGMMTDTAGTRPFRMHRVSGKDTVHIDMYDTIPPAGEVLVMTVDGRRVGATPAH
jgi:Protein of unknown function (DUF1579)